MNGEGNGTPLQYSFLENPTDGGTWWAVVPGVAKSWPLPGEMSITSDMQMTPPLCWEGLRAGGEGDDITDSMDMGLGRLRELVMEQEGPMCCDSWGRKESDMTEQLNWTN